MATLMDLTETLFGQIEKLNNDELSDEEFDRLIKKNDAIYKTASNIISIAKLSLEAQKEESLSGEKVKLLG